MYNWNDNRGFAQANAVREALSEVSATGALYAAAQGGELQAEAEEFTNVRYNADGSLYEAPVGGVWLAGMAAGLRPVAAGEGA